MIHFITAYDPATRANFAVVGALATDDDPVGDRATRDRLLERLQARPEAPLFAMAHGAREHLLGHGGAVALSGEDAAVVAARSVFAWACYTALGVGPRLARSGCTWWGYAGAISAPGAGAEERPIFEALFRQVRDEFASRPAALRTELKQRCDEAAGHLDELGSASVEAYSVLLHLWHRLRVWTPVGDGETACWRHPESRDADWMP